jgi:hypothetical protein
MPYALTFRGPVAPADLEQYINECCIGGDVVLEQLLPLLGERYGKLEPTQEDWGWFLWFEHAGVKLAVDVFTNDATTGEFQLHLTSRKPRFLLGARVQDTPELEALRELVVKGLEAWPVAGLEAERVDDKYDPA